MYRSKRHRLTSPEETNKFLRKYKELRLEKEEDKIGEAAGGVEEETEEETEGT